MFKVTTKKKRGGCMMEEKNLKLQNQLVLSIRYARLKEEIKNITKIIDTEKAKEGLAKLVVDKKRLNRYEERIKEIKKEIENIEIKYKQKQYMLYIEKEVFNKIMSKLSKKDDFNMLKYEIAIKVILDGTCDFNNTKGFLENLSQELFNNKTTFVDLMGKLEDIYCKIKGIKQPLMPDLRFDMEKIGLSPVAKTVQALGLTGGVVAVKKVFEIPKYFKPGIMIAGGIGLGAVSMIAGINSIHKNKVSKQIKKMSSNDLECTLCEIALCIKQASTIMKTEFELKKYYSKLMELVNKTRTMISQELFEKWINKKENEKKIELLNNFDNYVVDFVK